MDHRFQDEHMPVDDDTQEETQKATQTQTADDSQEDSQGDDAIRVRYWGYLVPYVKGKERVFLERQQKQYRVGRAKGSDILLKGPKVSEYIHTFVMYDGGGIENASNRQYTL
jgi:pSer/pThr/pTyr-binding forkhead associated (FHA) protein